MYLVNHCKSCSSNTTYYPSKTAKNITVDNVPIWSLQKLLTPSKNSSKFPINFRWKPRSRCGWWIAGTRCTWMPVPVTTAILRHLVIDVPWPKMWMDYHILTKQVHVVERTVFTVYLMDLWPSPAAGRLKDFPPWSWISQWKSFHQFRHWLSQKPPLFWMGIILSNSAGSEFHWCQWSISILPRMRNAEAGTGLGRGSCGCVVGFDTKTPL